MDLYCYNNGFQLYRFQSDIPVSLPFLHHLMERDGSVYIKGILKDESGNEVEVPVLVTEVYNILTHSNEEIEMELLTNRKLKVFTTPRNKVTIPTTRKIVPVNSIYRITLKYQHPKRYDSFLLKGFKNGVKFLIKI